MATADADASPRRSLTGNPNTSSSSPFSKLVAATWMPRWLTAFGDALESPRCVEGSAHVPRRVEQQAPHLCVPEEIRARSYHPRERWLDARRPRAPDDDEYVGLVADDVDHLGGELVQLRATVNCHVPAARQGLVLTAVAIGELELREAVLRTAGTGR